MYAHLFSHSSPKVAVRIPGVRAIQYAETVGLDVNISPDEPAAAFIGKAREGQIGDTVIGIALTHPFAGAVDTHGAAAWLEGVRGMADLEASIGSSAVNHAA